MTRSHNRHSLLRTTWVLSCSLAAAALILNAGCHSDVTIVGDVAETVGGSSATLDQACSSPADCASDEWCQFLACPGFHGPNHFCRKRPTHCDDEEDSLVCGSNGVFYANECEANMVGVDVHCNSCPEPEGTFRCGSTFCQTGKEACMQWVDGGGYCTPLTEDCELSTSSCEKCLPNEDCSFLNCNFSDDNEPEFSNTEGQENLAQGRVYCTI